MVLLLLDLISGATNAGNNATFEIATVVAGTITLDSTDALTVEAAAATVTIIAGTIIAPASTANPTLAAEGFSTAGSIIVDGTTYAYKGIKYISANTIAFVDSNPDTITDSGDGFIEAGFEVGDVITVDSDTNDGTYTITAVAKGTLTLTTTTDVLVAESAGTAFTVYVADNRTFMGVTPDPTTQAPVANSGIAQAPDTTTYSTNTKGNILLTAQRKLWIAGEKNYESRVTYTQTGDVTATTGGSGLSASGSFTLIDKSGDIKLIDAVGPDALIVHKENSLIKYTRGNDGTSVIEQFDTLSSNNDVGASNLKAGAGLNQISYYMTKTEGLKSLEKALQDSSLNLASITDVIAPSIADFDFSSAAAVYFPPKKVIYISCKSTSDVSVNDKVIAYYIRKMGEGGYTGELSIDDMFVADWIVDGTDLYYVSSIDQNSYKMFTRNSDNGSAVNHLWESKEFTFDEPARGKEFNILYVEGFIKEGTKIKATVSYGVLGSKGSKSKIINWDDSFVSTSKVSALGDDVVGINSVGAVSASLQDSFTFAVPIHFDINKASRYKVKFETVFDSETSDDAFWAVSNLSTNPDLKAIDGNEIINSNS